MRVITVIDPLLARTYRVIPRWPGACGLPPDGLPVEYTTDWHRRYLDGDVIVTELAAPAKSDKEQKS